MNAKKRLIRANQAKVYKKLTGKKTKKSTAKNSGKSSGVRKMFGYDHMLNEATGKWERIK